MAGSASDRKKSPAFRETGDKTSTETAYYLFSTPLSAVRGGEVVRSHWGGENRLHGVSTWSMNEDAARNRMDNGPHNLAVLRHMALNVMRKEESSHPYAENSKSAGMRITRQLSRSFEMQLPCAGVLIFVSLAEHYARNRRRTMGSRQVDQSVCRTRSTRFCRARGEGEIAEGFVIAVEKCGHGPCRAFSARAWGRGPAAGQDLSDLTSMFRKSCSTFSEHAPTLYERELAG